MRSATGSAAAAPAVAIDGLRCTAPDGRITLDVAQLRIDAGERVAVIGPNGAGKSTLLGCLTGFANPSQGTVHVLGHQVMPRMAAGALRRLRTDVAQVLQGLHLVQRLSALDNVLIGALARLPGWRSWPRLHRSDDVSQALRALDAVGLRHKADARADRLSGGERQRVAVARMLMQQPRLVLADEPTASLDPSAAADICRLLRDASPDATLVAVVHQAALLPQLADRVIGLRQGRIVFDGPVTALTADMLADLYAALDTAQTGHQGAAAATTPGIATRTAAALSESMVRA